MHVASGMCSIVADFILDTGKAEAEGRLVDERCSLVQHFLWKDGEIRYHHFWHSDLMATHAGGQGFWWWCLLRYWRRSGEAAKTLWGAVTLSSVDRSIAVDSTSPTTVLRMPRPES